MDDQQTMIRGRQAAELLEHPLLVEAFGVIETNLRAQWLSSPARDAEAREKIYTMTKLLEALQLNLKEVMESGQLVRLRLDQKRSLRERLSNWGED